MTAPHRPVAAIVGPGNIGTDLLMKLQRSGILDVRYMVGVDPASDGLRRARGLGVETSADGVDWLLGQDRLPDVVFEATSAKAHLTNAPRYREAGILAVDLTPAAVGPFVCPAVNLDDNHDTSNINMITCGGQATVPIVAAISAVTEVPYAEIIASISSRSAGPGTRANIDEFTETTAHAVKTVGGARRGKAIIILNPVEPPMIMRDTIFAAVPDGTDQDAVAESIHRTVATVQTYVPGYRLKSDPQFDEPRLEWDGHGRVGVFLEVAGKGDYLPEWAGNLDIMTAAAARAGELLASSRTKTTQLDAQQKEAATK